MIRRTTLALLLTTATVASAQQAPAPTPAKPAEKSPGETCLDQQPQWVQYANGLKQSRDILEQDNATLRAQLAAAQAKLAELEKKK